MLGEEYFIQPQVVVCRKLGTCEMNCYCNIFCKDLLEIHLEIKQQMNICQISF